VYIFHSILKLSPNCSSHEDAAFISTFDVMRLSQSIALIAYLAIGVQSHVSLGKHARQVGTLSVSLAPVTGKATEVEATITNNGADDLSLLKVGTFLDDRPVEKVKVVDENGMYCEEP
jgi:hypothetical protein